jgi:hypothetical protein
MALNKRKSPFRPNRKKTVYLTKRILESAARKGIRRAAKETMEIMGYAIIARDGWIIKLYPDGTFDRVSPIELLSQDQGLVQK